MGIIRSGDDLLTQAQNVKSVINQNQSGTFGAKVEGVLDMSHNMNQIIMLREKESAITDEVNKKFENRDKLMKEFGITTTETTGAVEKSSEVIAELNDNLDNLNNDDPTEPLKDAFKELEKQISDLDIAINNAIDSGNSPLVEKLTLEKQAADLLLDAYKRVKEAFAKGWDMDQRDLGPIGEMVARKAGLVVSDKADTKKSPFQKKDFEHEINDMFGLK